MLNKVTLIGQVDSEPEIRSFPNGKRVANFTLCTSEKWRDKVTGDEKQKIEWHRVAVFNDKLVDTIGIQVHKGIMLMVEGQLETRKYTDAKQQERTTTDIVLRPYKGGITILDALTPIINTNTHNPPQNWTSASY